MACNEKELNVLPKGSSCIEDKKVPSPSPYFNSDEVTRCSKYATGRKGGGDGKGSKKKRSKKKKGNGSTFKWEGTTAPKSVGDWKQITDDDFLKGVDTWVGWEKFGSTDARRAEKPLNQKTRVVAMKKTKSRYNRDDEIQFRTSIYDVDVNGNTDSNDGVNAEIQEANFGGMSTAQRAIESLVKFMDAHPNDEVETFSDRPRFRVEGSGKALKNNVKILNRNIGFKGTSARVTVRKGSLRFVAIDKSNVLMTDMEVTGKDADSFKAGKTGVAAIAVNRLWDDVRAAKMGDDLAVYVSDSEEKNVPPYIEVEVNGETQTDGWKRTWVRDKKKQREIEVPDLPVEATAKTTGKEFKKVSRGAKVIMDNDDRVWLVAESGKAGMYGESGEERFRGVFKNAKVSGNAKAAYGMDYLRQISMVPAPASTDVTIKWADEMPLTLEYKINSGDVKHLLAPRIGSQKKDGDKEKFSDENERATLNEGETLPFPQMKDLVMHCAETVEVGQPAPDIQGINQMGEPVEAHLHDQDEAVVFFYPNTMGCRCSVQAMQFQELHETRGTPVYGIATAPPEETADFAESYNIEYPLLSDPTGEIASKFGVGIDEEGKMERATFFVKDGQIVEGVEPEMATANESEGMTLHQSPELLEHIEHPSVVVVTGERNAGKSSTAFHIAEEMAKADDVTPVAVGMPEAKREHLPNEWVTVDDIDQAPSDSVVVVDEAYRKFHARRSQSGEAVDMSSIVNLSRHCGRTIVFVTQEARQLDPNAVSQVDAVFLKRPAPLQIEFERPQMRRIMKTARDSYEQLPTDQQHQAYTYVFTREFQGLVSTGEASFYDEDLSKSYEGNCGLGNENDAEPEDTGEVNESPLGELNEVSFTPSCRR